MGETGLESPLDRFAPLEDELLTLKTGDEFFTILEFHAFT